MSLAARLHGRLASRSARPHRQSISRREKSDTKTDLISVLIGRAAATHLHHHALRADRLQNPADVRGAGVGDMARAKNVQLQGLRVAVAAPIGVVGGSLGHLQGSWVDGYRLHASGEEMKVRASAPMQSAHVKRPALSDARVARVKDVGELELLPQVLGVGATTPDVLTSNDIYGKLRREAMTLNLQAYRTHAYMYVLARTISPRWCVQEATCRAVRSRQQSSHPGVASAPLPRDTSVGKEVPSSA